MQSLRGSDYTTTKIECETIGDTTYKYTYDEYGNITDIIRVNADNTKTLLCTYYYDTYNQLTTVIDYENLEQCSYAYNLAGNITKRIKYKLGTSHNIVSRLEDISYSYGDSEWKDLLTSYGGQSITYDTIGNPLTYRDGITLTWQNGRELATYSDDNYDIEYTYDASGMRTGKTVTNSADTTTSYTYVYENGQLLQMCMGSRIYDFSYDANGTPISIAYRTRATATPTYYYYAVNSRGDITALYNGSGSIVAVYEYDAYGKLISVENATGVAITSATHIANMNPLRYRGYVYDTETGFYYLQSRYYDPTTCRFINEDIYYDTGRGFNGYNMFAYCNNNPIMSYDPTGTREPVGGGPISAETKAERALSCAYRNNRTVYTSIDDAAKVAGTAAAIKTSKDNMEHAFATYSLGKIGDVEYYYNGPMIDGKHASVPPTINQFYKNNLVSFTHSHPYCNGHIYDQFSIGYDEKKKRITGDAGVSYYLSIPIYLAAPNGTLSKLYWENGTPYTEDICYDLYDKDKSIYFCTL